MKVLLLALLLLVAASAIPIPNEDDRDVDAIVNDVIEEDDNTFDISEFVTVQVNEHAKGVLVPSAHVIPPFKGLEAAVAAAAAAAKAAGHVFPTPIDVPELEEMPKPEPVNPELPTPVVPPEQFVMLPYPATSEVTKITERSPIVINFFIPKAESGDVASEPDIVSPEFLTPVTEDIEAPEVDTTEVTPEVDIKEVTPETAEPLPFPEHLETYNDGNVQAFMNVDRKTTIISTLKEWFNIFVNYINGSAAVQSVQII